MPRKRYLRLPVGCVGVNSPNIPKKRKTHTSKGDFRFFKDDFKEDFNNFEGGLNSSTPYIERL